MDDEPAPLSWEETKSLYTKASVPCLAVVFVFVAYLGYQVQYYYSTITLFGLFTRWMFPFSIAELLAWHISVEVLYHLRVTKSLRFHLRRFALNSSFLLAMILSAFGVMILGYIALSSYIGDASIMLGWISSALIIAIITMRFQNTLRRNWKAP
jgi:hypothetical protein